MKKEKNLANNNFHSTAGKLPTTLKLLRTGRQTALHSYIVNASEKCWITVTFWLAVEGRLVQVYLRVPSLNRTQVRWAWPCASWCRCCCSPGPASAPPSLCPSPPPSAGWPESAAGWTEMAAGCASWTAYRTECRPPREESDRSKLGNI